MTLKEYEQEHHPNLASKEEPSSHNTLPYPGNIVSDPVKCSLCPEVVQEEGLEKTLGRLSRFASGGIRRNVQI